MTKTEAISLLKLVSATMPNLKFDLEQTGFAWSIIMPDINYEIGSRALIRVLRRKTIPTLPTPGEIIESAKDIINSTSKVNAPDVYEAWDEVKRKLGSVTNKEIQWSHPIVMKTVLSIGAYSIATADYDMFSSVYYIFIYHIHKKSKNFSRRNYQNEE